MQQAKKPDLLESLLGRTRAGILRVLLSEPDVSLSLGELASATSLAMGSIHYEARMLSGLGLLVAHEDRSKDTRYQANQKHRAFRQLRELVATWPADSRAF